MTNPAFFLVALGAATELSIRDTTRAGCWPARGLLFDNVNALGQRCELFIRADDLLAFADLAAVSLFKPVCLPLELAEIMPGRINAILRHDPHSRALAAHVLRGLPDINPAEAAGGVSVQHRRRR